VAQLAALTHPKPAPVERSNFERHIYFVDTSVTHVLMEADQDLHVVLEDGPAHMVAESPNAPFCTAGATAYRRKQMLAARDKVRICSQARIVGVVFWDRPAQRHRQSAQRDRTPLDPRLRLLQLDRFVRKAGWVSRSPLVIAVSS